MSDILWRSYVIIHRSYSFIRRTWLLLSSPNLLWRYNRSFLFHLTWHCNILISLDSVKSHGLSSSRSSVFWSGHSISLHTAPCVEIDKSVPYFDWFCIYSEMSVLLQLTNPVSWRTALPQANDTQNTIVLQLPPFKPARCRNANHHDWTSSFSWHPSHPSWSVSVILSTSIWTIQSMDAEPYRYRGDKMHQISDSSIPPLP